MPRKRISNEEHIAAGTYRRDRHGPKPVTGDRLAERPPAPEGFTGERLTAWNELAAVWFASGRLTDGDLHLLEVAASALATFRAASASLDADGPFCSTPNGYRIANPAVAVQRNAARDLAAAEAKFGLDGAKRPRQSADAAIAAKIGPSPRAAARNRAV